MSLYRRDDLVDALNYVGYDRGLASRVDDMTTDALIREIEKYVGRKIGTYCERYHTLLREINARIHKGVEVSKGIIAGDRLSDVLPYGVFCLEAALRAGRPEPCVAVHEWEMRLGKKPPEVQYVNLSKADVKLDLGKGEQIIAVGGNINVPVALGQWRGHQPPIMQQLAPQLMPTRITCQTCETLIGQADPSGMIVEWVHRAPCGLPCSGRGSDADGVAQADKHHDEATCMRCRPIKCPSCAGKGQTGTKSEPRFAYPLGIRSAREYVDVPIYCKRCNGRGKVPGLDTWLAEHDNG